MVWAIVVVAIVVLGLAAWAGTGRLGEMPEAVTDRPKAHIPDGPVDEVFLENLSLPTVATGYRRAQVDAFLSSQISDAEPELSVRFDVTRRGYDMQAVDEVIERLRATTEETAPTPLPNENGEAEEVQETEEPVPTTVNAEPSTGPKRDGAGASPTK